LRYPMIAAVNVSAGTAWIGGGRVNRDDISTATESAAAIQEAQLSQTDRAYFVSQIFR